MVNQSIGRADNHSTYGSSCLSVFIVFILLPIALKKMKVEKKTEILNNLEASKFNFSFGGHLVTNSFGLVAKGFF